MIEMDYTKKTNFNMSPEQINYVAGRQYITVSINGRTLGPSVPTNMVLSEPVRLMKTSTTKVDVGLEMQNLAQEYMSKS